MTPRERTNAAVRSRPVDRVPKEMAFTPAIAALVHERTGGIVSSTGWPSAASYPTPSAPPSTPGVRAADYFGWEDIVDQWNQKILVGKVSIEEGLKGSDDETADFLRDKGYLK